jgi:hypothetical protein
VTCCDTPTLEDFAVWSRSFDPAGNFMAETPHMFPGCVACGWTFCGCGRQHRLPQRIEEDMTNG